MIRRNQFGVFLALLLCGVGLGYWFHRMQEPPVLKFEPELREDERRLSLDLEVIRDEVLVEEVMGYPANALEGERILTFTDADEYRAFLSLLDQMGYQPLGKMDALLSVRVEEHLLNRIAGDVEGGRVDYSYRVARPLPPVDFDPKALGHLRGFGASARVIVNGHLDGDGSGVTVAVLDSGLYGNAQFEAVAIEELDLTGQGVEGVGAEHGTAVSAIITGQEGVAPNASLLSIRVLDDQGLGSVYEVAEGIVAAVDHGAQIINLSLGLYEDTAVLRNAVAYADQQGVVLVAAAGNDGLEGLPFPAAYESVLAVTAVDANGQHAVFPNQSDAIDIAAPGLAILAAYDDEKSELFTGTSAAAPFVSGTLAALMSENPEQSARDAVKALQNYLNDAGPAGDDAVYGAGILDWERLAQRDDAEAQDLALTAIYLDQAAVPGTMVPIEVVVQNQGNTWLSDARVSVEAGKDAIQEFTLEPLAPGQVTSRKVYAAVPGLSDPEQLKVSALATSANVDADWRLQNNLKTVYFKAVGD